MSTNAHTPGPLLVKASAAPMAHNGDVGVINSKGSLVAVAYHRADSSAHEMAHLIAVAPKLLEACETFAHWLATEENHELMPDFYARVELCNLAQQQVRAALAKTAGSEA